MAKKKWSTPKLIILERGSPEESCLLACKPTSGYGPPWGPAVVGPGWSPGRCSKPNLYSCGAVCNVTGSS